MGNVQVGVILDGNFLSWVFSRWELSGGDHPGGNFLGGSFPSTKIFTRNFIMLNTMTKSKIKYHGL